jgi:hypothetical protein
VSRGPGTWQRRILRTTGGTDVATVSGVVRIAVSQPTRDDFTAARRATKQLALAERVSATYAYACVRCGEIQDREVPEACCGSVRAMLAVCQPQRLKRLAHPAPFPGGSCPPWINVVPVPRPAGQFSVPSVEDLCSVVLKRCYEGLVSGRVAVSLRDAAAILRLAHERERDAALAERDRALAELGEATHGIGVLRSAIVRKHGYDEWRALAGEVKEQLERDRQTRAMREHIGSMARRR